MSAVNQMKSASLSQEYLNCNTNSYPQWVDMFTWLQEIEDNCQWPYSQTSSPIWGEGRNLRNFCHFPRKDSPTNDVIFKHRTSQVCSLAKYLNPQFGYKEIFFKAVLSLHLSLMCAGVCQLTLNDCLCQETVPSPKFLVQVKSWNQKPGRRCLFCQQDPVLWVHEDLYLSSSAARTGS